MRYAIIAVLVVGLILLPGNPWEWIVYAIDVTLWNLANPDHGSPY